MAAVHAEEKLPAVDTKFIDRTLIGGGAATAIKGLIWGNAVAISQAIGQSFYTLNAAAKANGTAIDMSQFKKQIGTNMKTFWPAIVGTTTLFSVVRGNDGSTIGITGGIKPLLIASVPAIGYAAYTRAMPPQALIFGVYSAGLLHLYDRVWHPKGMMLEHMPIAHVNRRVL